MGCESTAASPGGKRARDPEEEVYLDNFHSHKRYLSEIMASSLNGLTVGDSLTEHLMESPARDDVTFDYSPMSEDSDDSRFGDNPENGSTTPHPDIATRPTSPVSPHGHHPRLQTGSSSANMLPLQAARSRARVLASSAACIGYRRSVPVVAERCLPYRRSEASCAVEIGADPNARRGETPWMQKDLGG
ncbi:hypothetical protein HPP92_016354 [Vanilla planifolia]|uniref:Uncharacterized protein n=1 Tax=Vanilla planifolia TaxID=51239 RepID=A0A835QHY1_VANPL|nr:hypothetical protein HPP92_016354 [Vanilla planifolia]